MTQRPAHTLIFVGAQRTDRVDFGPAPAFGVLAQHHQVARGGDDLVIRVEAAFGALPKVGKQVWVLWEGASSQALDMPAGVVEGLDAEQLADSLSFEAETLTGLSAAESAIHGVLQPAAPGALHDFRRYWVTQVPASLQENLQEAVARVNSKLAAIAHPGGLPREQWDEPPPAAPRDWRRIEVWDQVTFGIQGRADGSIETRVIHSAPRSETWLAELPTDGPLSWLGPAPRDRQKDGSPADSIAGAPGPAVKIEFPADAVPVQWLTAWATELTSASPRVPAIRPPSNVSPYRQLYIAGGVAAGIILLICFIHAQYLSAKTSAASAKADTTEQLHAQFAAAATAANKKDEDALTAQTQKLQSQLRELSQQEAALAADFDKAQKTTNKAKDRQAAMQEVYSMHRPAMAALLAALAGSERDDDPGKVVVKEVRQQATGDLRLSGLCRQSALADAFATRLAAQLGSSGWRVGPAQKRLREDLLAFDFTIVLTPIVLLDAPATVATPAPRKSAATPPAEAASRDRQAISRSIGGARS